jgi:outer membrane protein
MNRTILCSLILIALCISGYAEELHLTLVETLRRAAQNNNEVLLAQTGSQMAAARTGLEKASFYPRLSVGTGAAATYGFPLSIEGSAPSIFEVNFIQTIYDRRQRKQVDSARLQEEGAEAQVKAKQQEAALEAGQFYLSLRNQRQRRQYYQAELESLKKIREIISNRVESGVAEPRELTKAKLEVARATLALTSNERTILLLEEQLKQAVGAPSEVSLTLENDDVPRSETEYSVQPLIETALSTDPILMQLRIQLRSHQVAEEAFRAFRPAVDLVGKYGLFAKYNNYDLYFNRFQSSNALVGLTIHLPLSAPELSPERRRLKAAQEEVQRKIKARSDQFRLEAQRELAQSAILKGKEEVAGLEMQLARENMQVAQAKYEQGRIPLAELEQARREESLRWIDYLDAKLEQEKVRLSLYKRTGFLLQEIR